MRITRATDYGIMGLVYLAGKPKGTIISIGEIAEELNVSRDFLVRIFDKLSFIRSFRGSKGGIRLTKDPKKITFYHVIRELEGDCAFSLDKKLLRRFSQENDALKVNWNRLNEKLIEQLRQTTIESCIASREGGVQDCFLSKGEESLSA